LLVNVTSCAVSVLIGGFDYFFIMFLSVGFLISIGFKELYRKNEYLFYLNNGISKWQLLLFSYLFTFIATVIVRLIVFLIKALF